MEWNYKVLPEPVKITKGDLLWDDLVLPLGFRPHLQRSMVQPILENKPPFDYSAIIFGPPGTGKTSLLKSIARQTDWELFIIGPQNFVSENRIEQAMALCIQDIKKYVEDKIKPKSKSLGVKDTSKEKQAKIIFAFDEIDELVVTRDPSQDRDSRFSTTMMLPLFQELRDLAKKHTFIFFVLTNHIERFDPAIRRRGRFDLVLPLGPPDRPARFLFFEKFLEEIKDDYFQKYNLVIRRYNDRVLDSFLVRSYTVDLDIISRASARLTLKDIEAVCCRAVDQQMAMENISKVKSSKPSYLNLRTRYFIDWIHKYRHLSESKNAIEKFYNEKESYSRGSSIYPKPFTIQENVEQEFTLIHVMHNLSKLHNVWKKGEKRTIEFSFRNLTGLSYFEGKITASASIGKIKKTKKGDEFEFLSPSTSSNIYKLTLTPSQSGKMVIQFVIDGTIEVRGIEELLEDHRARLRGSIIQNREITIID